MVAACRERQVPAACGHSSLAALQLEAAVSDTPVYAANPLPPQPRDLLRWAQMTGLVRMRPDGTWHLTDLGRKSTMRVVGPSPACRPAPASMFKDM
jgi:hypothetical protein